MLPVRRRTEGDLRRRFRRRGDAQDRRDYVATLVRLVRELGLEEHRIAGIAARLASSPTVQSQRVAAQYVQLLLPAVAQQRVRPDAFRSYERDLDGEFGVGSTVRGARFGVSREELNGHALLTGQSGSGKSTLLLRLLRQAREMAGVSAWLFARKPDADYLAREGFDVIPWRRFRLNPLLPIAFSVSATDHAAAFVKAVCGLFGNLHRGQALLLLAMHALYAEFGVLEQWHRWDWGTMRAPCLADLLDLLKSKAFGSRVRAGLGMQSLWSLVDKLESLLLELGPVVACQRGFDFPGLHRDGRGVVLSLAGLPVGAQNFLILMLFVQHDDYFRLTGPWNRLRMLFFVDESKGLFGREHRDFFLLKDRFSTCREHGTGCVLADQIPSELAQFAWSNFSVVAALRHSDGKDQRAVAEALGLTREQREAAFGLQQGQAIVRTRRLRDVHLVQVPADRTEKFIGQDEVDRLVGARLGTLGEFVIDAARPDPEERNDAEDGLSEVEERFLRCLAEDFDVPSSEVYRRAGLGNSAGYRIKRRLKARGLLSEVVTNLGKGGARCVFLVPDTEVLERFGIAVGAGRGGMLHKFYQAVVKEEAERAGAVAVVEDCRGGRGEGPDVGVEWA